MGPYEVLALVGAGGMGEVYRARDSRLGRDVALKLLPSHFSGDASRFHRFELEARATAQINHPNILSVYDIGQHGGCPYIVSEFLEGRTIAVLQGGLPLPARKVVALATQVASGLAAAHDKGIVHRDLKPSNLMVTSYGRLKILDFGLAKLTLPTEGTQGAPQHPTRTTETDPGTTVGTVGYMSPEQVRGWQVDLRSDVFSLGAVLYEMLCGRRAFSGDSNAEILSAILTSDPPELGRGDGIPPALERIVRRCLEKDPEDRFRSAHDLALALESVLDRPVSGPESREEGGEWSPYPGLRSFTEADAGRFFGREEEAAAIWEKIRRRPLLAVIGPSGAGKTSFVLAGVVAGRPAGWGTVVCTPGPAPLASLARALAPEVAGDAEALRRLIGYEDPDVLVEVLDHWRGAHTAAVLVVDQFEELFTLNPPAMQERFAALLGRLAGQAHLHILLSLRDDFLMRCHDHEALAPIFAADLTPLGPLSGEALRRALVVPAENEGFRFEEDSLVPEMIAAVAGERGALPLLAFAVARLWDKRDREKRVLTRKAYDAIGGVAGCLAQHAEETLQRIGSERQVMVRELFRNLVTSEGTRAACERHELVSVLPEGSTRDEVLRELIDARLLTSYEVMSVEGGQEKAQHRVEVVHESLLTAWPRLVLWRAQDQEGALLRDQLRQAAQLWEEKHRPPDLLWTGTSYREFELWRERYPGALTAREEAFARAMVERARRRKRLLRTAVAAAFVVLAAVAAAIAVSRQQAVASQRRSLASRLLTLAQLRLADDPTEALAYDIASLEVADSPEARIFAARVLAEAPPAFELVPKESALPRSLAFSPDGHYLAAAGHTDIATVWADDGRQVARLAGHVTSPRGPNIPRWASPGRLVTGGVSPLFHLWSIPEGQRLRSIDRRPKTDADDGQWELGYWTVEPDRVLEQIEKTLPSGHVLRRLRSLSLLDGRAQLLARFDWTALGAVSGEFAPLGRGFLYGKGHDVVLRPLPSASDRRERVIGRHGTDIERLGRFRGHPERAWSLDKAGAIRIWSFSDAEPKLLRELRKPSAAEGAIGLDPEARVVHDAPRLGWAERSLRLWDTVALPGARPVTLRRSGSWYGARSDFHPSGHWVAISTAGNERITFWPLGRAFPSVVPGYTGLTRPLAFSPDGEWLATSWSDNRIQLWPMPDARGASPKTVFPSHGEVALWETIAFEPRGRYLFAVGVSDNAWIIPLDGSPARRLPAYSQDTLLMAAAVSPSGRHVATAFYYGKGPQTLRIHDLDTSTTRTFALPPSEAGSVPSSGRAAGYARSIYSLAFVDDVTLYSGGDGGVRRWNTATGSQEVVWATPSSVLSSVVLLEDGRTAFVRENKAGGYQCSPTLVLDLMTAQTKTLPQLGACPAGDRSSAFSPSGRIAAVGNDDGTIRVGPVDGGGAPHVFVGHEGTVDSVALSPDLRWLASTGEDNTLRLWPLPDLSKAPLYAQPHAALIAKLKSLTNLRAVPKAGSNDWTIEVGPFPGWKEVPTP